MLGRDECIDVEVDEGPEFEFDAGGGGNAAALNEDEWIGLAPRGPLPGPVREEEDVEEKERVGLSVLGVMGMEFELVRGGVARVGGRDWGCGCGAGKGDEKDWVAKGEGEVGLCACEASVGEAKILPHTSSLQSVPPPAAIVSVPRLGLSALTIPLAPATKLSKSTGWPNPFEPAPEPFTVIADRSS